MHITRGITAEMFGIDKASCNRRLYSRECKKGINTQCKISEDQLKTYNLFIRLQASIN